MDPSVHAIDQGYEPREASGEVELDELDDYTVGRADIDVADRACAPRLGVNVRSGVAEASQHTVEVGSLQPEVCHSKPRTKRACAHFGWFGWCHAWGELADHQELSAEEHAVVPPALAGRDGAEMLGTEARLVEPNRRQRVARMNMNVVE